MNQIVRKTSGLTFFVLKVAVIIFIMFSVMGFLAETAARMRMRLPQPFRGAAVLTLAVASAMPFVRVIDAAKRKVIGSKRSARADEQAIQSEWSIPSDPQPTYFELFSSAWNRANLGPSYANEQELREEIDRSRKAWGEDDTAIACDDLVIKEAIYRGLTKEQTLAVLEQSPHLEELGEPEYAAGAKEEYLEGLAKQFVNLSELNFAGAAAQKNGAH